ncbi:hypothetical protein [Actinomadura litoris]|uniref:hypothetical protein n=1 Tax=Actinomadura litoris TaxID=2678616 RepID=UPI001FA6E0C7|nr:hypothetical protein [Actinomadura litoris]
MAVAVVEVVGFAGAVAEEGCGQVRVYQRAGVDVLPALVGVAGAPVVRAVAINKVVAALRFMFVLPVGGYGRPSS